MEQTKNFPYIMQNRCPVHERGEFTISDGVISPVSGSYQPNQYIRIMGSLFNDSIFQIERVGDGYIDVSIHDEDYAIWFQPTGGHDAWPIDARVIHNGIRYVSMISANAHVPGTDERWWRTIGEVEHSISDETFSGMILPLAIKPNFLELVRNIEKYVDVAEKDPKQAILLAESFGGYSYSKAAGRNGLPPRWQEVFSTSLKYKMYDEAQWLK